MARDEPSPRRRASPGRNRGRRSRTRRSTPSRARRRWLKPSWWSVSVALVSNARLRADLLVVVADRRNEVLAEGAIEIVTRLECPVGARGRIVHIGGPRVHDSLALRIDSVRDLGPRKRRRNHLADVGRRSTERSDIVGRARESVAGG